jgi:hypothetical protein
MALAETPKHLALTQVCIQLRVETRPIFEEVWDALTLVMFFPFDWCRKWTRGWGRTGL